MLTFFQAITLGALQGITELFPISSLGHSVILPTLIGWRIDEHGSSFLVFLVATHFATAIVLFCLYWRDWLRMIAGVLRSFKEREIRADDADAKLGWLLIVSTIPAGLLGILFKENIQAIFLSARSAALFLTLNGLLLFGAERVRRGMSARISEGDTRISRLSYKQGLFVGAMQALALIPGFSRTGASLAGGLLVGLSHEDALRFSFLLATPVIGAAAALELPGLWGAGSAMIVSTLVGAVCAGVFAYLSATFLSRYFRIERHTLTPFAIYCLIAGITALIFLR